VEIAMGMFVGIALGGAEWFYSQLEATSTTSRVIYCGPREFPESASSASLLKAIDQTVSLQKPLRNVAPEPARMFRSEADASKDAALLIRKSGLPGAFKELIQDEIDFAGTIGVTHPYGMSPTARRSLPALIGWNPIEHHRVDREERVTTIYPEEGNLIDRVCAVEAPFAALLELLSRQSLCHGDRVLVIGESTPGLEITQIGVSQHEGVWRLAAEKYCSGTVDDPVSILAATDLSDRTERLLILPLAGAVDASSIAGELAHRMASFSPEVLPVLSGTELASGAARYAALCSGMPVAELFNGLQDIEFSSVAPFPIGVCGLDSQGRLLWCPLVEAGEVLPVEARSVVIRGTSPIPSRLILAECLRPGRVPGEFEVDPAHLRWYAELPIDGLRNAQSGAIHITLESSTQAWGYGWSDPFLRGLFVAAS